MLAAVRRRGGDLEADEDGLLVVRRWRGLPPGLLRRAVAVGGELRALLSGPRACESCGGETFYRRDGAWACLGCTGIPHPVPQRWRRTPR